MPLSDVRCRNARPGEKLQKLSDAGGLQLWVTPTGSRLWRFAYRFGGKQKLLALGAYPIVSLAAARDARDDAKKVLSAGLDPSHEKKVSESPDNSFRVIAEEYLTKLKREGRTEKTISKTTWLLSFAYPSLGDLPIKRIDSAAILKVLREVENRGRHESARRLRSTIGSVFRYAIATVRADSDPTIALHGALIAPKVKSRAAITDPKAFGALLRAVDNYEGQPVTEAALKLMALVFPRPGELRAGEWSEFDLDGAIWIIPETRMKMRRPHRIPLSAQAIAILKRLHTITGKGKLVFPSVRTFTRPISDVTMNAALRRMGYTKDEATAHGFRASASTLLNESGLWHPDAIERQLAHLEGDDVRRAYTRGDYWEERVRMMQWWADHLDSLKKRPSPRVL